MTWVLAGLAFGVLRSVDCIGMGGSLPLSLPGPNRLRRRFLLDRLIYNLGRPVTYTLLDGLVGALGHAASPALLGVSLLGRLAPVAFCSLCGQGRMLSALLFPPRDPSAPTMRSSIAR